MKADGYDVECIGYNDDEALIQYGITKDINVFFCLSEDYNKNLFITLSARNLDKSLNIISLASDTQEEKKMLLAGANKIINPYTIGANRIFRLIKKPVIYQVLDEILYQKSNIKILELEVPEESSLIGQPLSQAHIEDNYEVMVLGLQDGKNRHEFKFNTYKIRRKITQGDILVIIGEEKNIMKLKKELYT